MSDNSRIKQSDDELWQLVHENWPSSNEMPSPEFLAEYVDGFLCERTAAECERLISRNPECLDIYVMLLQMQDAYSEDAEVSSDAIDIAIKPVSVPTTTVVDQAIVAASDDSTLHRFALLATALAASVMAIAFGVAYFRGNGLQDQLASVRRELTQKKLEDLQMQVDLVRSDSSANLWLGNPTQWYGSSSTRMRGGSEAIPQGFKTDLRELFAGIESTNDLNIDQKLWLADLQVGVGEFQRAKSTLDSIAEKTRSERWTLVKASMQIAKHKGATASLDRSDLEDASAALVKLLHSENLRPQALFNLAALRLVEGRRLIDIDFPAARRKLDECIGYADEFLRMNVASSLKHVAEAMRQQAIALRTP